MRKALRYRLFGVGRMPTTLKSVASGPDVLVAEEGISVTSSARSFHLGVGIRS